MSEGAVRLTIADRVATVLFDRPKARNAMTMAMYDQLSEACAAICVAPGLRVAVFKGAGNAFVAGTDIGEFLAFESGRDGVAYEARIERGLAEIEALPVPTLAVIDGVAMGGGMMIAVACDLRVASERSRFGVPIATTLGNCLSARNVARLERAIGLSRAKRLLLLGEHLEASEALASGLLAAAVPEAELEGRAAALVDRLLANAPLSIAAARQAFAGGADDAVIEAVYGSTDFREGVRAFLDKRPPRWTGK